MVIDFSLYCSYNTYMNNNNKEIKKIQSVQRALDIIEVIANENRGLSLNEISNILELNIGTIRGLVNTLILNGYLNKTPKDNKYYLGYEFLIKSQHISDSYAKTLRNVALPYMEEIANKHKINVWLQVCISSNIYTVNVVECSQSYFTYRPKIGAKITLHASVSGKLYIANLNPEERELFINSLSLDKITDYTISNTIQLNKEITQIIKQGHATIKNECELGMSEVGVPIKLDGNLLIGTLSIVAPSIIIEEHEKELITSLKEKVIQIEGKLEV